jgi:hypothetical protein
MVLWRHFNAVDCAADDVAAGIVQAISEPLRDWLE